MTINLILPEQTILPHIPEVARFRPLQYEAEHWGIMPVDESLAVFPYHQLEISTRLLLRAVLAGIVVTDRFAHVPIGAGEEYAE